MSTTASRYADYNSACPRCQQIINTIDITCQQGIFIYDLTFIQQELESALVSALQRKNQLVECNEQNSKLSLPTVNSLANGKKGRDFKAERDRKRKAFGGQITRKRRRKNKNSTMYLIKKIKREHNRNNCMSLKTNSLSRKTNENSTRPIRSYRPINFSYPFHYETNYRNGHQRNYAKTNKLQPNNIPYPDQFWTNILNQQHEFIRKDDWKPIETLININQTLLNNVDDEKVYSQYKQMLDSEEYLLSKMNYVHPELECSMVIKKNLNLYDLVGTMINTYRKTLNNYRLKRKYSSMSNSEYSIDNIDESIANLFRRDNITFQSKHDELQYRLAESISLERIALIRAEKQFEIDSTQLELNDIDDKILEISNSIRQRKRPSESALSLCKFISPISENSNHQQNGTSDSENWRKGLRQSTLRIYDELARLVDERINIEKQLIGINSPMEI